MRQFSGYIPSRNVNPSFESQPLSIGDNVNFWIGVTISGNDVAGTLKLQASFLPTGGTWFDIVGSSQAITSSADFAWNVSDAHYPYVRVSWTYSSGTGNISAVANINEQMISKGA